MLLKDSAKPGGPEKRKQRAILNFEEKRALTFFSHIFNSVHQDSRVVRDSSEGITSRHVSTFSYVPFRIQGTLKQR